MAGMKDIDLSNATVTYNGVTFGGSSAAQTSLPPRFRLGYRILADDTRRVFKGLQYTLTVQTVFYEANQAALAANQQTLAAALSTQGKSLAIRGLGLGLDTIIDIDGGPHPLGKPEMRMIGENAWELLWTVVFTVNPCLSTDTTELTFLAFNYTTRWSHDFEGNCTRGISGAVDLVHVRNPAAPKTPVSRAEHVRPRITIVVPDGFRRIQNDWFESPDKKRLEFSVTDQQMQGDPFPPGIIEADASESFTTNPMTWAKADVTLSANLRIAPGSARTLGGVWFLTAAMTKQGDIAAALPAGSTVIPTGLSITAGKFNNARTMSASMSWQIVGCAYQYLISGGIWRPVGARDANGNGTTYTQWRTSIENLWDNRGNAELVSRLSDDVIIDLCDGATEVTIGRDTVTAYLPAEGGPLSLACPEVPEDGGWMLHDLRVQLKREDHQTLHRKAVTYEAMSPGEASLIAPSDGYVMVGGEPYVTSAASDHVIEKNGLPSTLVILEFRAKRYRRKPVMPEITTVGGMPVTLVEQRGTNPYSDGDMLGCPVYSMAGYRIYRVVGLVATIRSNGQKTSCADSTVPTSY